MKRLLGLSLIFIAIVGGIYLGGYICFFMSIVNIFDNIKAGIDGMYIAINICKILFAAPIVVYISFAILGMGLGLIEKK